MSDEADKYAVAVLASDPAPVAAVREAYHTVFEHTTMSDCISLSIEGTQQLDINREGFTYGESSLRAVYEVMSSIDLSAFAQADGGELDGRRRTGAVVYDLGSGIGNVVVGVALLAASGALCGVAEVHGVELLPTLHAAAEEALARLPAAAGSFAPSLPPTAVHCSDLLVHDFSRADVVYMASTVFQSRVLAEFAELAARVLRAGTRVITLHEPLHHAAFAHERVLESMNSWGRETIHVHVVVGEAHVDPYRHRVSDPYRHRVSDPYRHRVSDPYRHRVSDPYRHRVSEGSEKQPLEVGDQYAACGHGEDEAAACSDAAHAARALHLRRQALLGVDLSHMALNMALRADVQPYAETSDSDAHRTPSVKLAVVKTAKDRSVLVALLGRAGLLTLTRTVDGHSAWAFSTMI
jgi:hypothetical protein